MSDGKQNYWLVEGGIGTLSVGDQITTNELSVLIGQIAQNVWDYTKDMKCVSRRGTTTHNRQGMRPVVLERNSLPGDICTGCAEIDHCILRMIFESPTNLQFLPRSLALLQEME